MAAGLDKQLKQINFTLTLNPRFSVRHRHSIETAQFVFYKFVLFDGQLHSNVNSKTVVYFNNRQLYTMS